MGRGSSCRPTWIRSSRTSIPCWRSEEHTSELQSQSNLVCRLLLEKKKKQAGLSMGPSMISGSTRKTLTSEPEITTVAVALSANATRAVPTSLCTVYRCDGYEHATY